VAWADYHMHLEPDEATAPCPYTLKRIEEYLRHAHRHGVEEVGISEHCHRFREFREIFRPLWQSRPDQHPAVAGWLAGDFQEPLARYVEVVLQAQSRGWPVRLGLEVDFLPGTEQAARSVLQGVPWDYLIGSVHFVDGAAVDFSPEVTWPGADVEQLWERYFHLVEQAAGSGLFDVLAHLDLPKKFGHRPQRFPHQAFRRALEAARQAGLVVELNTAGLRRPAAEVYPAPPLLREVVQAGLDVQLGSDAHRPEEVGAGFSQAAELARQCGVSHLVRWRGRRRHPVPL